MSVAGNRIEDSHGGDNGVEVKKTAIEGAFIIEPKVFGDDRGYFLETYSHKRYQEAGIPGTFIQDNLSFSRRGVLRGLHFQNPNAQGKLVSAPMGEVFDVAVDIRKGSPTFGKWVGVHLSGQNKRQFWVPPGLAHGFVVLSETALFSYKCTEYYSPKDEHSILWNDPDIGIEWPISDGIQLSGKDQIGLRLKAVNDEVLPIFGR
jgi:dTDP-4-dehydrorhamnose 3,5-epimerase